MVNIAWIDDKRRFEVVAVYLQLSGSQMSQRSRIGGTVIAFGRLRPRLDGCGCRVGCGVVMFEGVGSRLRHCWSAFVARGDELGLVRICCPEVQRGYGMFVGIVRRSRPGFTSTLIDDLR